jgi:hypothetical protein
LAATGTWQASLRRRCAGLEATLWRRTEPDKPGLVTLMEVYVGLPAALHPEVEAASPLATWLRGSRHIERFDRVETEPGSPITP